MRINRLLSAIVLSLGVGGALVSAALAETDASPLGPPAGSKFEALCDPGQAVVGFIYNAAETLTAIVPLCEKTVDGVPTAPVEKTKAAKGVKRGRSFDPMLCKAQSALVGVRVLQSGIGPLVRQIQGFCLSDLSSKDYEVGDLTQVDLPAVSKTSLGAPDPRYVQTELGVTFCAEGTYGIGIFGTYVAQNSISSVGLRCSDVATPEETTADSASDQTEGPAADDPTTDQGDNGGDGFNVTIQIGPNTIQFGKKGKIRTAGEATTIYADTDGQTELAYLDKGDKVTVLACENKGRGWCQISKPEPGFVWGGDLKK